MKWGNFEVTLVSGGGLWLDGGAMYGVVPRTLWSRLTPPDAENRIEIALHCLLVRTPAGTVLVDTGIGDKFDDQFAAVYRADRTRTVADSLRQAGVDAGSVDVVINTHLHFDHAGGNTRREGGRLVPAFPSARYVVQRGEWRHAQAPGERSRASYRPEDWEPLAHTGQLECVEGDVEVLPGVFVFLTPGHLRHHQSVRVRSGGRDLVFLSDVIPTPHHLKLPWIMSYDLYPLDTLETKRQLIRAALDGHWLLVFYHDPQTPMGYLREQDGRLYVDPVTGE